MFPFASKLARGTRGAAALLGFALAGFALFVAPAPASAQTPVVFGDEITEPGVYFLHGNQTGSGDGITILSDDVALFLGRFTLRGDGTGLGITSIGYANVLIQGGRVTNFRVGINVSDSEHATVKDVRVDHCVLAGLRVIDMVESSFLRMRSDHNGGDGVEGHDVDSSRFLSILTHDNGRNGIRLQTQVDPPEQVLGDMPTSKLNKIKLCWAAYNRLDGIRVLDGVDNEIERNQCVNNQYAGIRLGTLEDTNLGAVNAVGSQGNFLRSNWCVFNDEGILVEWGSADNTLTNNTALANFGRDLVDRNYERPCVNTWFLNFFLTKDGAGADCIF